MSENGVDKEVDLPRHLASVVQLPTCITEYKLQFGMQYHEGCNAYKEISFHNIGCLPLMLVDASPASSSITDIIAFGFVNKNTSL
jgi:hypothetical protein